MAGPAGLRAAGVVTPEAVVLELDTAGVPSRLLAALIDLVVQILLLLAVLFGGLIAAGAGFDLGGLATAGVYVAIFLIVFGYPVSQETLWQGRTLGKAALGLRVVTADGMPITFRHAAIRAMLALVDKWLLSGAIGIIAILVTARNQRLGDLVAGTIVLRERTALRPPSAITFSPPPGLEGYVATLDVAGLDHRDYAAVRSFLVRAAELSPAVRFELARNLAAPLVTRLHPAPPSHVGPDTFLACVAAAYQRRSGPAGTNPSSFRSVWDTATPAAGAARGSGSAAPSAAASPQSPDPPAPEAAGGFAPPG